MAKYNNWVKFRGNEEKHSVNMTSMDIQTNISWKFIFKLKEIIINVKTQFLCFE